MTSGLPAPGWVRDAFGPQLGSVVAMLGASYGGQAMAGDGYPATGSTRWKAPAPSRDQTVPHLMPG